ncbi:UDP-3-O-(3-hydroxymyristoyl) N-acetylglucosamine deacetylase [Chthonomonas calidirosea]|uniref:UDP-3-O-acyl-N-acetylglucosamine deacetylase n=1 Tax=Chthonomonas calidirosea (strain DSM 23976 / ICMP 18418 / T49) TaxID=1303518 RepID=S0EW14_CHTCT|nr:UDP-3-O-acyl-N-acetylglucosamine deacetylase [Chthonomonas calidirosea]CCW36038.1 UDP-3-O-[3-hydroxymyristoyl] N-acetylglucosamine deacetylase [Chthonomonas calidirosea T49]CEK17472.1 UDP-3-O-(3-hydroxymyristoyl) N-acetylglucosamine deacetylase [Chthonomonas calidirosea]CEK18517.1 UDP-3-O-(3-hydroxymyristoyl) N-acetylglucosamine deacetylase [Chthonomonas calidirosea]
MTVNSRSQHTLASAISVRGTGIHTGASATVHLRPAPTNFGRIFWIKGQTVPATAEYVVETQRCTTLGNAQIRISTVEHLLSALFALEVDNVLIEVEGPELPILDGSAWPWVEAIMEAGIISQEEPVPIFYLQEPLSVAMGKSVAECTPAPVLHLCVKFVSEDWPEGTASAELQLGSQSIALYKDRIAPARTFALRKEVEALLAAGLARGGTLENALLIDPPHCFSSPLRVEYEWVAHKLLDLIGDLALVGACFNAHVEVYRPGHTINTKLAQAIYRTIQAPHKGDITA